MIEDIDLKIEKFTTSLLVIMIFMMMGLSFLGIIMRPFHVTFMWLDPVVRHLVFGSAFLGGSLATSQGSHIAIDVLIKVLETKKLNRLKIWVIRIIDLITLIILYYLMKAGLQFVQVELEFGREAFLNIHSGELTKIIPYGFFLIGIRFLLRMIIGIQPNRKEVG